MNRQFPKNIRKKNDQDAQRNHRRYWISPNTSIRHRRNDHKDHQRDRTQPNATLEKYRLLEGNYLHFLSILRRHITPSRHLPAAACGAYPTIAAPKCSCTRRTTDAGQPYPRWTTKVFRPPPYRCISLSAGSVSARGLLSRCLSGFWPLASHTLWSTAGDCNYYAPQRTKTLSCTGHRSQAFQEIDNHYRSVIWNSGRTCI
jgi:hypothetical protein